MTTEKEKKHKLPFFFSSLQVDLEVLPSDLNILWNLTQPLSSAKTLETNWNARILRHKLVLNLPTSFSCFSSFPFQKTQHDRFQLRSKQPFQWITMWDILLTIEKYYNQPLTFLHIPRYVFLDDFCWWDQLQRVGPSEFVLRLSLSPSIST